MTASTLTTMEELVVEQCDEFIQNGKPFSAVAVTEALKLKELRNPTNGVDIRHRNVNEIVRQYMAGISNSVNYIFSLTNPKLDFNGRPIHAPDGVYVYHTGGYDANLYPHPVLTKPLSLQGVCVTPPIGAATPFASIPQIVNSNPFPSPPKIQLPLVNVRYTMTDDNPQGQDTHILRATFSMNEVYGYEVYRCVVKKIHEKIESACDFESDENPDFQDPKFCESIIEPIIIHLKFNDENDKTQESTYKSFDEFDKDYGLQFWKANHPTAADEDEDAAIHGNLVSSLPNGSKANLPDLHLPIYNDGRVGIPAGVVKDLKKDAIILRVGDVAGTVKFTPLQEYLSAQD